MVLNSLVDTLTQGGESIDSFFTGAAGRLQAAAGASGIMAILLFIAYCMIFKKAGQKLYVLRALIPIVNFYTEWKISYGKKQFWTVFFMIVVGSIFFAVAAGLDGYKAGLVRALLIAAAVILYLIALIKNIIQKNRLSKAFDHNALFTLGLLFLPNVFYLILGFEKNEWKGVQK